MDGNCCRVLRVPPHSAATPFFPCMLHCTPVSPPLQSSPLPSLSTRTEPIRTGRDQVQDLRFRKRAMPYVVAEDEKKAIIDVTRRCVRKRERERERERGSARVD